MELHQFVAGFEGIALLDNSSFQKKSNYVAPPKLAEVKKALSHYAYSFIESKYIDALVNYQVTTLRTDKKWKIKSLIKQEEETIVQREGVHFTCECTATITNGLPCTHVLAAWNSCEKVHLSVLQISPRWHKDIDQSLSQRMKKLAFQKMRIEQEFSTIIKNPTNVVSRGRKRYKRFKTKTEIQYEYISSRSIVSRQSVVKKVKK